MTSTICDYIDTHWILWVIRLIQLVGVLPISLKKVSSKSIKRILKRCNSPVYDEDQQNAQNDVTKYQHKRTSKRKNKKNCDGAELCKYGSRNDLYNGVGNSKNLALTKSTTYDSYPPKLVVMKVFLIPWCILSRILFLYSLYYYYINLAPMLITAESVREFLSIIAIIGFFLYSFGIFCSPLQLSIYLSLLNKLLREKYCSNGHLKRNHFCNFSFKVFSTGWVTSVICAATQIYFMRHLIPIIQFSYFFISCLIVATLFRGCCVSLFNSLDLAELLLESQTVNMNLFLQIIRKVL